MLKKTRESIPNRPEGILDKIGPRTLDGGYSPSQDISSAMFRAVGAANVVRVGVLTWATGAKAVVTARTTDRITKLNLAILENSTTEREGKYIVSQGVLGYALCLGGGSRSNPRHGSRCTTQPLQVE